MANDKKNEDVKAQPVADVELKLPVELKAPVEEKESRYEGCIKCSHLEVYHPVSAQMGKAEQSWDVKRHARIWVDENRGIAHIIMLDPVDPTRAPRSTASIPFSNVAWYCVK
jgi:hypothetical protein